MSVERLESLERLAAGYAADTLPTDKSIEDARKVVREAYYLGMQLGFVEGVYAGQESSIASQEA